MSDIQTLQAMVQEMKDKIDVIVHALMGNPERPNIPGVIIRLDRLEQSNRFKNKVLWLFGSGLALAAVKFTFPLQF